jgi:hypothetical protein
MTYSNSYDENESVVTTKTDQVTAAVTGTIGASSQALPLATVRALNWQLALTILFALTSISPES